MNALKRQRANMAGDMRFVRFRTNYCIVTARKKTRVPEGGSGSGSFNDQTPGTFDLPINTSARRLFHSRMVTR
jgi:hypothetical protein